MQFLLQFYNCLIQIYYCELRALQFLLCELPPLYFISTGSLRCSADLTFWKGPLSYSLNITSSDQVHTAGPINIQVDITNLRKAPTLTIPPASDSVLESDTGRTQVGTAVGF